MPITPYTGPFGTPELRHLLRRTLFGVSQADLAHFNGLSLDQVVDELLTFTNDTTPPVKDYGLPDDNGVPDPSLIDTAVAFGSAWVNTPRDPADEPDVTTLRLTSWAAWWMGQLVQQQRNLREKLTLFWHNHMPTQVSVVFNSEAMYGMNQVLRTHAMGNFKQLMHDVSISPGMLYYLNGYLNVASAPDENYGRELMELFTLGEGSGYTESDVQAAARVLTGWTVQEDVNGNPVVPQTIFVPADHTTTDKQFSGFFNGTVIAGQSGPNAGENELQALLQMITSNPACGRFIARELYHFFVHGEIDAAAEAEVITPLGDLFLANIDAPDQLRTVVRALLTSDHFFSAAIRGCMVKPPADLVIGELRLFGMPWPDASLFEARNLVWTDLYYLVSYAGQSIADPPNVAGWPAYYSYPAYDNVWLDTATFPARNNSLLGITYNGFSTSNETAQAASANLQFKADLVAFVQQFTTPEDPNALVAQLCDALYAPAISQSVKDQLKTNYLLFGQSADHYWTDAFTTYVADPNTTVMSAQLVPDILHWLIGDMQKAAEHHLL